MRFLDFVFGVNNTIISREKRWEAAQSQQKSFDRVSGMLPTRREKRKKRKKNKHITQSSTQEEKETKESLKELLRSDKDLAPILKLTESLVDEALSASAKVV
eukprot:scaffold33078_cov303-Skeletonema_menzelii.AAC.1